MHKPETRVATVGARDKVEEGEQYRKISKVENGRGSEISKFWSLRERLETFFFRNFRAPPIFYRIFTVHLDLLARCEGRCYNFFVSKYFWTVVELLICEGFEVKYFKTLAFFFALFFIFGTYKLRTFARALRHDCASKSSLFFVPFSRFVLSMCNL